MRFLALEIIGLTALLSGGCSTLQLFFAPSAEQLSVPGRSILAKPGSEFARNIQALTMAQREESIIEQAGIGNVPSHARRLVPIPLSTKLAHGQWIHGKIFVAADYFAIGSDRDFVRMPMTPMTAQKLADHYRAIVPTRKMVDAIYRHAEIKLAPKPLPPTSKMTTIPYYLQHQRSVEAQLVGKKRYALVAGHKKDIVNTVQLDRRPQQVAIYGWHRLNGKAIQPLSLVHINTYADYSHGLRLVRDVMEVNGKSMLVRDVLAHPQFHSLVSDEGVVRRHRLPTAAHRRWPDLISERPKKPTPAAQAH